MKGLVASVLVKKNILFATLFTLLLLQSNFAQKKITGIFDSGWSNYDYSNQEFKNYYTKLKALGINSVIYQFSLVASKHEYYPSGLSWATYPNHQELYKKANKYSQEIGLNLYLALYYEYSDEWWGTPDNVYLKRQASRCIEVFEELEKLYGTNPRVKGYYLPHEIARHYWKNSNDMDRLIKNFLKPVTDYVHNNSSKKIIASPFFNDELESPEKLRLFINQLFANWQPDIVALQDGIGVEHATLNNVAQYLRVVAEEVKKKHIEYWTNIELFEADNNNLPADVSRIIKQIEIASPISEKLISYDNSVLFKGTLYDNLLKYQITDIEKPTIVITPSLSQNYPNPFNPVTTIGYSIPVMEKYYTSTPEVILKVYNIIGQEVAVLVNRKQHPGDYIVKFDASQFASGIYFYKLQSGDFAETKKMILLR